MRRLIASMALALFLFGAGQVPALAHASLTGSSPTDGSVVRTSPKSVTLKFSEAVTAQTIELKSNTATVATTASSKGNRIKITPQTALPRGLYAASWVVESEDSHVVNGSIAFAVGVVPAPKGSQLVNTVPAVRTTLNTQRAGIAQVRFPGKKVTGNVQWQHLGLQGPLTWSIASSAAQGILPFPGKWTMQATLIDDSGAVISVTGSVVIT